MNERETARTVGVEIEEGAACGPSCVEAKACECGTVAPGDVDGQRDAGSSTPGWAPRTCTLTEFAQALRAVSRPTPQRLRLVLDRTHEDAVRDLVARERECCAFFTFTITRHNAHEFCLDITAPPDEAAVVDGLAKQAATVTGR